MAPRCPQRQDVLIAKKVASSRSRQDVVYARKEHAQVYYLQYSLWD